MNEPRRTPAPRDDASQFADMVERVRKRIDALPRNYDVAWANDIGQIVFEECFNGDEGAIRYHGRKTASMRRLSALLGEDAGCSVGLLHRSLRIHMLLRRLPSVARLPDLTIGHLCAVLALPERHQERLLRRASFEGWAIRRLRAEVRQRHPPAPLGRRRTPPLLASLLRLDRDVATAVGNDAVTALTPAELERALAALSRVRDAIARRGGRSGSQRTSGRGG